MNRQACKNAIGFVCLLLVLKWVTGCTYSELPQAPFAKAPTPTERAERFDPRLSSVAVIMQKENGGSSLGTGTLIVRGKSLLVITAAHVVDDGEGPWLFLPDPEDGATATLRQSAKVLARDETNDIAVLSVGGPVFRRPVFVSDAEPQIGDALTLCGLIGPSVGRGMVTTGIYAARGVDGGGRRIHWTDAQAVPGFSGGGVFNSSGELVGVIHHVDGRTYWTMFAGLDVINILLREAEGR